MLSNIQMFFGFFRPQKLANITSSFPTLIIIFTNVLTFMTIQTAFFWYIASNNIENIIDKKSHLIIEFKELFPEITDNINTFANSSDFQDIKRSANESFYLRQENNKRLLYNYMIPPFTMIICMLSLVTAIERFYIKKFDKIDGLILSTVFMCFLTEIIFYFTIIHDAEIISDIDVIIMFISNMPYNVPISN